MVNGIQKKIGGGKGSMIFYPRLDRMKKRNSFLMNRNWVLSALTHLPIWFVWLSTITTATSNLIW